jgi:tetratricopeptide repeat protein
MAKCFVVMGFGIKTDYQTGRKLDLDKSYSNLIKPAVKAAGLECVRADEIVHAGVIDVPMYEQLLTADVVVADVSTMNPNAFYELGVRHALKPYTTIIVSESELTFPFDVGHSVIRKYRHLGEDIGVTEALRFTGELTIAIQQILAEKKDDSPVYTFLKLNPPTPKSDRSAEEDANATADSKSGTLRTLLDAADAARKSGKWPVVKVMLEQVREEMKKKTVNSVSGVTSPDPYIVQQLALATYKADSSIAGLREAHSIMGEVHPETSNDPETLGLWGAIHKRLWEATGDRTALDEAITAHERGFYIRNDPYNGINCAFLLHSRAFTSTGEEATADKVLANRIRLKVISICKKLLEEPEIAPAERYWALATIAEAYCGLDQKADFDLAIAKARAQAPEAWMVDTTLVQIAKLEKLQGRNAASA